MVNTADPVTFWVLMIVAYVVMGTLLLIAVAFIRRGQQLRYLRYIHTLHRQHRPVLAKILSGVKTPAAMEALGGLSRNNLELLVDPLFSRRKLTARQLGFLQSLCADLGLIELWQRRTVKGSLSTTLSTGHGVQANPDHALMRHLLRAKSIRNLGALRHRPSWPFLVKALDDRHTDVQLVALRSLGAVGAPASFPSLCERLHAAVLGEATSPPLPALRAAMVDFDLACAPSLLPSLLHTDRRLRLQAIAILRVMVCRETERQPNLTLTQELLTPRLVELLLTEFATDPSADIRASSAEVIVFLADARAESVMRRLIADRQWFVRQRAIRALVRLRRAPASLPLDVRECLHDADGRVRETAIHTLIALGHEGKRQLYEHFLATADRTMRQQIVEAIEHTGLMSGLVEEYSAGTKGAGALIVEQLANDADILGLSGVLRTLSRDVRKKFLDRFLPYADGKMRFLEETLAPYEPSSALQEMAGFSAQVAA